VVVAFGHKEVDSFWAQHLLLRPLGLDLILAVFEIGGEEVEEEMEDGIDENRKLDQMAGCRWEEKAYSFLDPDTMETADAGETILLLLTLTVVAVAEPRILHNKTTDANMHTVHPMEKEGEEASHAS
jgi:hypothetical protein